MAVRELICRGRDYCIPVLLDDIDYAWAVAQGNWFITHGNKPGAKSYAVRSVGGRLLFLHKVVLVRAFKLPPTPEHVIGDHWDGNSFNDTRENLRWATHQMNARNLFGFASKQLELSL